MIGAEQPQVLAPVIPAIAIDVVEFERQRPLAAGLLTAGHALSPKASDKGVICDRPTVFHKFFGALMGRSDPFDVAKSVTLQESAGDPKWNPHPVCDLARTKALFDTQTDGFQFTSRVGTPPFQLASELLVCWERVTA